MKLLVVIPYFKPKIGGAENYALQICLGLSKYFDWKIVIVTSSFLTRKYIEEYVDTFKVYRLPILFKLSNTPIHPIWPYYINQIIEEEKPDIINVHTPVPVISDIAAYFKKSIPFITTYHGDMYKNSYFLNFIVRFYEKYICETTLSLSNAIICTSKYYVNKSKTLEKFKKKITIVSPGIDNTIFKPKKLFKRDLNHVLFVAQLDKAHDHKGLMVLLLALREVKRNFPKVMLHIVGDGDNVANYIQQVENLELVSNTYFHRKVSNEILADLYRNATVTVLPTINDSEGYGMVLLESMACGTPVIGSNVGGITDVINTYGGLLIEPNNVTDLVEKLIIALKSSEQIKINRNLIKNITWFKKVKITNDLFQSLIH